MEKDALMTSVCLSVLALISIMKTLFCPDNPSLFALIIVYLEPHGRGPTPTKYVYASSISDSLIVQALTH